MDTDRDMKIFTPKPAGEPLTKLPGEPLETDADIPIWQPQTAKPAAEM